MRNAYIAFGFGLVLAVGLYLFFVIPMDRPPTDSRNSSFLEEESPGEELPSWSIVPPASEREPSVQKPASSDTNTFLRILGTVKRQDREPIADSVPLRVTVLTLDTPLPEEFRRWLRNVDEYQNTEAVLKAARQKDFWEDDLQSYLGPRITRNISTNDSGEFELSRAPPGLYRINRKGQETGGTGTVLQLPDNDRPMTLTIGTTEDFEGRIVDSDGSPLEGVNVSFVNNERDPLRTNESGTFVIQDIPRQRPLNFFRFEKEGYKPLRVDRNAPADGASDTTFRMIRGTYLRVNVRTSGGGTVQEGAVVARSVGTSGDRPDPRVSHLRGEKFVEFFGLSSGKWSLRLARGPYISTPRTIQLNQHDSETLTLEAEDARRLVVEVLEEGTDSPVRNVRITGQGYNEQGERIELDLRQEGLVGPGKHLLRLPSSLEDVHLFVHPRRDPFLRPHSVRRNVDRDTVTVRLPRVSVGNASIQRKFRWTDAAGTERTIKGGLVEVYHRASGRRLLRFSPEALIREDQRLPEGELLILGFVRSSKGERVFSKTFGRTTDGNSTVELELENPAEITGTVATGSSDKIRVLGITPFNPSEYSIDSDRRLPFEIPDFLHRKPDEDGSFRFSNVPVGMKLYLVGSRGSARLQPGDPLQVVEPIGPLNSGERVNQKINSTY